MSNTRVFNYQEITSIYDQMNQIIGDSSDPSTIAGLLHKIDEDYHEVVNGPAGEDELALRGDLGMQLLNNWENTAGSFPAFVENFSSWSTLVAQTAGDYSAFEEQVRGIRSNNPLGWNTGGIQNGYVASSSYTNSFTDEQLDEAAAGVQMYNLVGAYYVDTGMVSYAKKQAFWNGFGDVLSVVSIVASGCSLVKGLGIVGGAGSAAGGAGVIDDGAKAGAGLIDDGAKAGAGLIDDGAKAGAGLIDDGAKVAGQSLDDLVAGGKPIANSTLYGLSDETAAAATDKLISKGYTLVDDTWQLPTNINANNSMFAQSVDDVIDDVVDDVVVDSLDDGAKLGIQVDLDEAGNIAKGNLPSYQQALHNVRTASDITAENADDILKLATTYGNGAGGTALGTSHKFNNLQELAAGLGKKIKLGTATPQDKELFLGTIYRISNAITADQYDDLVADLALSAAKSAL